MNEIINLTALYEAPQVFSMEVSAENGFAESGFNLENYHGGTDF